MTAFGIREELANRYNFEIRDVCCYHCEYWGYNRGKVLNSVGGCAWSMISFIRWDWRLRGKLTEDEYKAYQSCDRWFGFQDDKYLPTDEQIVWMAENTNNSCDTLWSMYNKLTEGH